MTTVKLTQKQAHTLLALTRALGVQTDTTMEVTAYDIHGSSGQRLMALQEKGLCERGGEMGRKHDPTGYSWNLTRLGGRIAEKLDREDKRQRGENRKAGGSRYIVTDLAGEYPEV